MPTGLFAPPHALQRRNLLVDVQHGLANRLRAMVSAAAIAQATDRRLVVLWVPDAHCEAPLEALWRYTGPVIGEAGARDLLRARAGRVHNYMEAEPGAVFEEPVLADPADHSHRDIYVRSAYSLVSPHGDPAREQAFLRALVPAAAVMDLAAGVPQPAQVALHVRMGTGPAFDHLPWESPRNWPAARHAELVQWREKSHVSRFVARLDALRAEGRADTIFAAADLPAVYAVLAERYGAALRVLERDLYDRSARQLQYALADMLLLGRADLLLASTWSSFSDMAQRLAPPGRPFEKSGVDF